MATGARTEPKPGAQELYPGIPHGWKGPEHLVHHLLLSPGHWQGDGLQVEWAGLQPVAIWNAGITSDDCIHVPQHRPALLLP